MCQDVGRDRGRVACVLGVNWGIHARGNRVWIRGGCMGDFIFYKGASLATKWQNQGKRFYVLLQVLIN